MTEVLRGTPEQAREFSTYTNRLHQRMLELSRNMPADFQYNALVLRRSPKADFAKKIDVFALVRNIYPYGVNTEGGLVYTALRPNGSDGPYIYYFHQKKKDTIIKTEVRIDQPNKEVFFHDRDIEFLQLFSNFLVNRPFRSLWVCEAILPPQQKRLPYEVEVSMDKKNFWGKNPGVGPKLFKK